MAKNYYCLVAGLPDILLGDKKTLFSSIAFKQILEEELTGDDYLLVKALFLPFDHINIINSLFKQEKDFDKRAVLLPEDIEILTDKKNLDTLDTLNYPEYIKQSVSEILSSEKETTKSEAEVLFYRNYIEYLKSFKNKFLNSYIEYDINTKNIFTALTARKYNLEYENELIGDNEVTNALIKSKSRDFGLSNELTYIEQIVQIYEEPNLLEREYNIDNLKWNYLDENTFFNYFSIEKILAFVFKLLMVERWISLDAEQGAKLFNKLLNDLECSYEFPEEYKLNHGRKK